MPATRAQANPADLVLNGQLVAGASLAVPLALGTSASASSHRIWRGSGVLFALPILSALKSALCGPCGPMQFGHLQKITSGKLAPKGPEDSAQGFHP
jgi:hypothetical protein